MTRIAQVMTRGVRTMAPGDSLMRAAQAMDELDVGALPVCEGERLVGMVTDRDIAIRGVAQGCAADRTPVADVMSTDVQCVYEDQSVEEASAQMRDLQIRRLPVLDRDDHLVGMLALGDLAVKAGAERAADALSEISEPAEPDRSGDGATR